MGANEIHKSDAGTTLRVTIEDDGTAVNIATATSKTIKLKKPGGTVLSKTAILSTDGTDGKMQYTTVAGDLDETGEWQIQGYAVIGSWTGHSDIGTFRVYDNLS